MPRREQQPSSDGSAGASNARDAHQSPSAATAPGVKQARRSPAATRPSRDVADSGGYRGEVPPPLVPPGGSQWTYVDRPEALAQVVGTLTSVSVLAIDAEFVQIYHRGPNDPPHRLALLQLAGAPGGQGAYVIDALRLADLSPLQRLLADPAILKLFHGMGADVRVLATRDLIARHTLDLEAVSRSVFGSRESSLQHMLLRACGIRLDKSWQRSDWTRRPLLPAMLAYAARDATMTLALYRWLALRFPWAVALHEVPDDPPALAVAAWLRPLLDGARGQRAEWAATQAGLESDRAQQAADLREALATVRSPTLRARVIRFIGELDLSTLAPELHPLLADPAAEVRTAAARTVGRLRDASTMQSLRALLADPVQDVREAAQAGLAYLASGPRAHAAAPVSGATRATRTGAGRWTIDTPTSAFAEAPNEAPWQAALRARFAERSQPGPPANSANGANTQIDETGLKDADGNDA